jgi:hypothetical protein
MIPSLQSRDLWSILRRPAVFDKAVEHFLRPRASLSRIAAPTIEHKASWVLERDRRHSGKRTIC